MNGSLSAPSACSCSISSAFDKSVRSPCKSPLFLLLVCLIWLVLLNCSYAEAPPSTGARSGIDVAANARAFAERGEWDFRAGDYKGAAYAWKHAVVDDPRNGVLTMLLGHALFAVGEYDKAAGATQAAMRLLPKDQWGVVVKNFRELYGRPQDYTTHVRALEKAIREKPEDPARRFLAGFHYAYLGYPKEAIEQLDKGLKFAPNDEMARKLREEMQAKLKRPEDPSPKEEAPEKKPEEEPKSTSSTGGGVRAIELRYR